MVAVVQTKSRANRIKLFKKFYRTATPSFRVYHGSRLPPKSFEGRWPHKKFFSSKIKVGAASKGVRPTKVKKILDTKPKAAPKKRKKRGVLKRKDVGKKKAVTKRLKKKKVTFSAKGKKAVGLRREQEAVGHAGRKAAYQVPGAAPVGRLYGSMPRRYLKRGDPTKMVWARNAQGLLVRTDAPKRRILVR